MSTRPICITLLASEWTSSKGGLSTMNRELATQLAKLSNTSVSFFVPKCNCCDEDKREADNYDVKIVEAEERPGYEPIDWLTTPPDDLVIDFVVGHGVILGKQAQFIRKSHQCKWIQVVHTAPDELAVYKEYSGAIPKGDEKQWAEVKLCKMADLVVAVGPKLTEFYTALLNACGKKVHNFTPGIFDELSSLDASPIKGRMFRILVFGRGDTEDFKLKGYDIAAKAVAKLGDKTYHLTFVGASKGSESDVTKELLKHGLLPSQLIVKGYLENRDDLLTLLCASNLVIIPSRTDGFGLTALEALSAGIPFLVSQNSGFGEALQEIPRGSAFIVDSEDSEDWAEAIEATRQKGSDTAFQECHELLALYAEKYKWEEQSEELLRTMKRLINEDDPSKKRQTSTPTPATAAESPNLRTSEPRTSLPELPNKKKSDERPSKEVPGERTAAQIRPTSQGARPKQRYLIATESPHESTVRQDLAILGCNVSVTSMDAVRHQIEKMGPELKLEANPFIGNFPPVNLKQFLETNSLRFCVLVMDSKAVKDGYGNLPVGPRNEYLDLLQTAVDRVAGKVIIVVCDDLPLPEQDKIYICQAIDYMVKERNKVFTTWLKKGRLQVDPDVFAKILISGSSTHRTKPQIHCSESFREQADASPCASNTVLCQTAQDPSGGFYKARASWGREFQQQFQQPHADTATAPKQYTELSPTCRERVLLKSKLRNGKISYLRNDLEAHCPGFQVPSYIDERLLLKYGKISAGVPVKIVAEPNTGALRWMVTPESTSIAKGMAVNETLVLETRIRYGLLSMEKGDLEFIYPGWRAPEYLTESLYRDHWATPNAKLFVISDEKGELRFLVDVRAYRGIMRKLWAWWEQTLITE